MEELLPNLFTLLDPEDIFSLSTVCHSISKQARQYINCNYFFLLKRFSNNTTTHILQFVWYAPRRITDVQDISELFELDEAHRKLITHLQFTTNTTAINKNKLDFPPLPSLSYLNFNARTRTHDMDYSPKEIFLTSLPPSLTILGFGTDNTVSFPDLLTTIWDFWPPCLTSFTDSSYASILYNQKIPPTVTHVSFCADGEAVFTLLPPKLTHLTLKRCISVESLALLPRTLTHLTIVYFNRHLSRFPPSLTHLIFCGGPEEAEYTISDLPSTLIHLQLPHYYFKQIDEFPPHLQHLKFGPWYNKPIKSLPSSLTYLSFGIQYNQPLPPLPPSLQHLHFGVGYDQKITSLPDSLVRLSFASGNNIAVENFSLDIFPFSLQLLELPHYFTRPKNLPSHVQVRLGGY